MGLEHKDEYRIQTLTTLRRIIYAGRGICILVSPSEKSHTYYFSRPKDEDAFPDDIIFVYVLHENKRFYIGMIERNRFRLTKNSRFEADTEAVKGAQYIVNAANASCDLTSLPMKFYHAGHCCKCGRKLSGDWAVQQGIGKKCLKKLELLSSNYVE